MLKTPDVLPDLAKKFYEPLGFESSFAARGMVLANNNVRSRSMSRPFINSPERQVERQRQAAHRHIWDTLAADDMGAFSERRWLMDTTELNACLKTSFDSRFHTTKQWSWSHRNLYSQQVYDEAFMTVGSPYAELIKTHQGNAVWHTKHWASVATYHGADALAHPLRLLHMVMREEGDGYRPRTMAGPYVALDNETGELIPFQMTYKPDISGRPAPVLEPCGDDEAETILNELIIGAHSVGRPQPNPVIYEPMRYPARHS
jgi:hypothetical protein